MKTIVSVITAGAILLSGGFASQASGQKMHVIADLKEAVWGPAPPMLPPGAQIAVLSGDPSKPVRVCGSAEISGQLRDSRALASHRRERCRRVRGGDFRNG